MSDFSAAIPTGAAIPAPVRKAGTVALALAAALAAGLFALPAAEARPEMAGQNVEARFDAMDADKNGQVSREEFFAAQPNMKEGAFAAIDADGDGALTIKEWKDFAAGHGKDSGAGATGGMPAMPPSGSGAPGAATPDTGGQTGPAGDHAPALIMPPRDAR